MSRKIIYFDWADLQLILENYNQLSDELAGCDIGISVAHILDIAKGDDEEKVIQRCKQLEQIKNKFFLQNELVPCWELANALAHTRRCIPLSRRFLIKDKFTDIFTCSSRYRLKEDERTVLSFIKAILADPKKSLVRDASKSSLDNAMLVSKNRRYVLENNLENELKKQVHENESNFWKENLARALGVLLQEKRITKFEYDILLNYPPRDSLLELLRSPIFFRYENFFNDYREQYFNCLAIKDSSSNKFKNARGSDLVDHYHLWAVAICDIVTVDRFNFNLIQNTKSNLKNNIRYVDKTNFIDSAKKLIMSVRGNSF